MVIREHLEHAVPEVDRGAYRSGQGAAADLVDVPSHRNLILYLTDGLQARAVSLPSEDRGSDGASGSGDSGNAAYGPTAALGELVPFVVGSVAVARALWSTALGWLAGALGGGGLLCFALSESVTRGLSINPAVKIALGIPAFALVSCIVWHSLT